MIQDSGEHAMPDEKQLALPGSSWDTVKKIIRAFYAAQSEENPKLEGIARLAAGDHLGLEAGGDRPPVRHSVANGQRIYGRRNPSNRRAWKLSIESASAITGC